MREKISASIIIPCYNCSKTIWLCLESISRQKKKPTEVIVVDDGSTDGTLEITNSFGKKQEMNIVVLEQKHAGPAVARNLGAKNAKNGIIVFLDSDCIVPPNWLEELVAPLQKGFSGTGCPYKTKNSNSLIARYIGLEIAFRHEKMLEKEVDCFGSYSTAFVKKDFFSVNGFDESFPMASGEDFALSFALHKKGKKLFFTGKTFVYHFHASSLQKFLRQQFWRGYWRVPLYIKDKARAFKKESYSGLEAQLQFFLSLLVFFSLPLSVFLMNPWPSLFSLALLFFSNLGFGFWCFSKEKKFFLVAPLIASARSVSGSTGALAFLLSKLLFKNKKAFCYYSKKPK